MVASTRDPSPEEIKRMCDQIQAKWTPWQERVRRQLETKEESMLPQVVSERELEREMV